MAVLDEAMEQGQRLSRDRQEGQINMFGAFTQAASQAQAVELPDVPPWCEADMLAYEKETLGFYITGHPLSRFKDEIKRFSNLDTVTVQAADDQMTVCLAGLATEIKEKVTKKGDRMAFVRLEDLKGAIDVIVFPDCYADGGRHLYGDKPVLVTGTIDKDERGRKLKASKIVPLEDTARGMTTSIRLRMEATGLTRERLVELKQILQHFPGSYRVFLHLNIPGKGEAVLALPGQYRVTPAPELIEQVNELFGHGVVEPVLATD
jgi:DNA polymerase-3 subunit alpha